MTNSSNHADYRVRRSDDKPDVSAGKGAVADFLQLLARAAHQFHTYPPTSPLCTDAVAACHAAFMALELEEPMTLRIGKRELLVQDEAIGRGTGRRAATVAASSPSARGVGGNQTGRHAS
jgi:hypothetical protein